MQEIMAIFEIIKDDQGKPEDMIIKDVNQAYEYSLNLSREKVIDQRASLIYGREFVDNYFKLVQKNPEIGKGKKFETYFPPLNKYYLTTLFAVGDALYVTLGIDITDRKILEKKLNKERDILNLKVHEKTKELLEIEKKLIKAQEIAQIGNWELDLKTNELWFNDEMYHIFGYNLKSVDSEINIQKLEITYDILLNKIVHPDDRDLLNKSFKNALKGKPYNLNHRIILPNGEERIIHEQAELIYNGGKNPIKMAGITQDITEHKKMETALKESEEKFREIFNNANDMITLTELNENGLPNRYMEVNKVGLKRLGYTHNEFLSMGPIDIVADNKKKEIIKYAVELWTKGHSTFEIVHVTKDGKRIPVEVSNHLFKMKGKNVALAIIRDITERKKSENELNELLEKLSNSNEELERFAYITSHDLQEPLRALANFSHLLKKQYGGKFDDDGNELIDYIADTSTQIQHMVSDLFEYSQISKEKEKFESLNLKEVVRNVLVDLNPNNVEITTEDLPTVTANNKQIARVFNFMIKSAITSKNENKTSKIHISGFKDIENREYVISIHINKILIDPQYTEGIFTKYHYLTTHKLYEGSFIDLVISKKIIEIHNGRIWVESNPNIGTTFYFTLPIKKS